MRSSAITQNGMLFRKMHANDELAVDANLPSGKETRTLKQTFVANVDLPQSNTTWFCADSPVEVLHVTPEKRETTCDGNVLKFSQVCYRIELEHASKSWNVSHTLGDCVKLWHTLVNYAAKLQRKRDKSDDKRVSLAVVPPWSFVNNSVRHRFLDRQHRFQLISSRICRFLRQVVAQPLLLNHVATSRFFECNVFSFLSPSTPSKNSPDVVRILPGILWQSTTRRWFFACDSYYGYLSKSGRRLLDVQLVDGRLGFQTDVDPENADNECTMTLSNLHRDLMFRLPRREDVEAWREYFDTVRNSGLCEYATLQQPNHSFAPVRDDTLCRWFVCGRDYMKAAAHTIEKYAKEQIFITDWWLSPEVLMCRPEYDEDEEASKNKDEPFDYWRLDRVLQRKAEQGVRVYILLYKEVDWAMGLNSLHTKTVLQARHENIKVLRHPDHWFGSQDVFMWSHHEKTICIDQKIAFVGGIDLCFGRWESDYRLVDPGTGESVEEAGEFDVVPTEMFQSEADSADAAVDQTNAQHIGNGDADSTLTQRRRKNPDFVQNDKLHANGGRLLPSTSDALLHDAEAKKTKRKRRNSQTMSRFGFIMMPFRMLLTFFLVYLWQSFVVDVVGRLLLRRAVKKEKKAQKKMSRTSSPTLPDETSLPGSVQQRRRHRRKRRISEDEEESYHTTNEKVLELLKSFDSPEFQAGIAKLRRVWPGKDYYNELRRGWANSFSTTPFDDYVDRKTLPRMPWQDIAAQVLGAPASDVARHFIERWNACKVQKKHDDKRYPFLVPKPVEQSVADIPNGLLEDNDDGAFLHCRTQVLRSATQWSAGIRHTEDSIQQAYLSMIQAAQKYIYIENQFFVTFPGYLDDEDMQGGEGIVLNSIGEAIVHRLRRAHDVNEDFHVYIVIPLLPAIEGKFGTAAGAALSSCVHYIYSSINRPPHALFERLRYFGIPFEKYITFSSLRTHGIMGGSSSLVDDGRPVTEIIYVHSKLLIVDDHVTIIGSANINDRSMLGARDSEVCILYRDRDFFDCGVEKRSADGVSNLAGRFAGSLRRRLWSKYLNVEPDDPRIQFPGSPACRKLWASVARNNTEIYRDLFACVPCDTIRTYQQLNELDERRDDGNENHLMPGVNAELAKRTLKERIRGYLVEFPLNFLADEDLLPVLSAKERVSAKKT